MDVAVDGRLLRAGRTVPTLIHYALAALVLIAPKCALAEGALGEIKICKRFDPTEYDAEGVRWWRKRITIPAGTLFFDDGPIGSSGPSLKFRVATLEDVTLENDKRCAVVRAVVANRGAGYVKGRSPDIQVGDPVSRLSPSDNRRLAWDGTSESNFALAMKHGWFDLAQFDAIIVKAFK